MSRVLALCVLLVTVAVVLAEDSYTAKLDNVNADEILSNESKVKVYLECLLAEDDKSCPEEAKDIRYAVPEILASGCKKCTDTQRAKAEQGIKFLLENDYDGWKRLSAKWDPAGEHTKKYEEEFKKRGVSV